MSSSPSTPLAEFQRLLDERVSAAPERRAQIDAQLWDRFGCHRAVLISDMARFSRITRDHGIIHFLALIRRMETTTAPVIAAHGGHLVKVVADNLFATFDTAHHALEAAVEMSAAVEREGEGLPENDQVRLSIGIAAGRVLDIEGVDIYGDAVNLASKLGEDIGHGGDILITTDAAAGVVLPEGFRTEARQTRVSAMDVDYLAVVGA